MSVYEPHLASAEQAAWPLETSVRWGDIDVALARREEHILSALRDAALIEGYLPVFAPRLMQLLWDDVDATAVLSLELYEGLRHYTALKRYLDAVGYSPSILSEDRMVEARQRALAGSARPEALVGQLTNFACSELFAAYFFLRLSRDTKEPVLAELLERIARDEFRHASAGADLLAKRVRQDPAVAEEILEAAQNFRHYGADIVTVPVAAENDFEAIAAMNRLIRQACGVSPTQHLQGAFDAQSI
ncbi:MAG: ferritin-like domain-containing protein [Gemmatimonadaceae bacterium]|nr:ferritin-like domain-containing protein [Gemmatimonadaceae bacterium]